MRAIVYEIFGPPDVLHLIEVEKPAPGAEEVLIKALVDRCYPLEQAAEAHRCAEKGDKIGSVIITV